jgi:Kelch motif
MLNARRFAQAAPLSNGKVLVMGGQNYSVTLAAAETYDPATDKWWPTQASSWRAPTCRDTNGHFAALHAVRVMR